MPSTSTDRIDGLTTSVAVKAPCKVATSSNIVLYGLQTIGGTAVVAGDRVLVTAQTSSVNNGIYVVSATDWARAKDFDGARDAVNGTLVIVGTSAVYRLTTANPITIGSSAITFVQALFGDTASSTFIQAGTGAVSRNAQSKMRERVTPEDFGAAADGVTDDAAAFTLALATLSTNGELLLTGGKTYLIGSAGILVSGKTNVHIRGNGAVIKLNAVSVLTSTLGFSAAIKFLNCTRCSISQVEINGNSKASDGVTFASCTDCVIEHSRVYSCGAQALISSYASTRSVIRNNVVYSSLLHGIMSGNYAATQIDTDVSVIGNLTRNQASDGIVCASAGGRVVENQCKSNGASGIIFGGAAGYSAKRLVIANNFCEANAFHGIQGDTVYTTVADLPVDISISGNVCYNNTNAGIYVVRALRWAITGNICTDNPTAGIFCSRFEKITLSGNVCCDSRAGGSRTQASGISLNAEAGVNSLDVVVSGNECSNNLSYGISCQNATTETISGVVITGNKTNGNGSRGIFVADAVAAGTSFTGISVVGNVSTGNTTADIRVDSLEAAINDNVYLNETNVRYWTFSDLATTPSVKGARRFFRCINTVGTTITNFTSPAGGQIIEIWFTTANTTINSGGNFLLRGGINLAPIAANSVIRFFYTGGLWLEISRNF